MSWGSLDSFRIYLSNEQHLLCLFKGKLIRTKGKSSPTINCGFWVVFVPVSPSSLYLLARTRTFQAHDFCSGRRQIYTQLLSTAADCQYTKCWQRQIVLPKKNLLQAKFTTLIPSYLLAASVLSQIPISTAALPT